MRRRGRDFYRFYFQYVGAARFVKPDAFCCLWGNHVGVEIKYTAKLAAYPYL